MKLRHYVTLALLTASPAVGLVAAPSALAECQSSGASTVCAQGSVRDGGVDDAPSAHRTYNCEDYYWVCDGSVSVRVGPVVPVLPVGPPLFP